MQFILRGELFDKRSTPSRFKLMSFLRDNAFKPHMSVFKLARMFLREGSIFQEHSGLRLFHGPKGSLECIFHEFLHTYCDYFL